MTSICVMKACGFAILELYNAITSYCRFHLLPTKIKKVVWTIYTIDDFNR